MLDLRPKRRRTPTIPIVSLVDILVILLIFFIATTTFRQTQTHMKIALPESRTMGGESAQAETRLAITVTKEKEILLDGNPIAEENLATALKTLKETKPNAKLELEADTDAALGVLVKVWDALRIAGYSINEVPARIQRAGA